MLRGRLVLASVHLCFVCVLALRQTATKPCSKDVRKRLQSLINEKPDLKCSDCRLYTPTINDYQQKCPGSTMKCFADEIQVLTEEWEGIPEWSLSLNSKLARFAMLLNQTGPPSSGCLQCELFKEETAEKFLRGLLTTIEMMNSAHC